MTANIKNSFKKIKEFLAKSKKKINKLRLFLYAGIGLSIITFIYATFLYFIVVDRFEGKKVAASIKDIF